MRIQNIVMADPFEKQVQPFEFTHSAITDYGKAGALKQLRNSVPQLKTTAVA